MITYVQEPQNDTKTQRAAKKLRLEIPIEAKARGRILKYTKGKKAIHRKREEMIREQKVISRKKIFSRNRPPFQCKFKQLRGR